MENLSFTHQLDSKPVSLLDDEDDTRSNVVSRTSEPSPAYRVARLLDGLGAYAAVFDCAAGCGTV